jgi:hypothetical protein
VGANLPRMRRLLGVLAACVAVSSFGQFRGEFVDAKGNAHPWQVSSSNALIWDDLPWIPVGPRVAAGDIGSLGDIAAAGLTSVLICFPVDQPLQPLVDAAEQAGLAYLLTPDAHPPECSGHYIMPQSYRVAGIRGEMELRLRVPGADSAFFVLADVESYGVISSGEVRVDQGFANVGVRPNRSGQFVLLLYPHVSAGNVPDLWEGYDAWRDALLGKLKTLMLGPGMRGIVDPLGRVVQWYDFQRRFVPESPLFRLEFERHLRRTYSSVRKLGEGWQTLGRDFESYGEATHFVPLFAEGRGVPFLWNPETNKLLGVSRQSRYWEDFESFIKGAVARRASNLSVALRHMVDVPIVYTWRGWNPVSQYGTAAGQGLGMVGYGGGHKAASTWGAHALGASMTWRKAPWLLAVDVAADEAGAPYQGEAGLADAVATLGSLGAKGFFVRTGLDADSLKGLAAAAVRSPPAELYPKALEFPETARTPADVTQLPGGIWWVPSPRVGTRLDYGEEIDAYRIETDDGTKVVMWSRSGEQRLFLRLADPDAVRVGTWAGEPIEPRRRRDGIDVVLAELPTVFLSDNDLPVPNDVLKATDDAIRAYFKWDTQLGVDFSDLKYDYNRALEGVVRNPGNAYVLLRDIYNQAATRVGRYVWLEGEKPSNTTFGYIGSSAAASDGRYLALDTPIQPLAGAYVSRYEVKASGAATMRLLVAGSLPEQGTLRFEWAIDDGTPTALPAEPVSYYGGRFAWYDAGAIAIPKGRHQLTISVRGQEGAYYEAAIDVVLLTAGEFRPSGVRRPSVPPPKQ